MTPATGSGKGHQAMGPGAAGRLMARATEAVRSAADGLDLGTLSGPDAVDLYASVVGLERVTAAVKLDLAARVDATGAAKEVGHRSTASLLGEVEGVAEGQAKRLLAAGNRLQACPATGDALRRGELSPSQAEAITGAAEAAPDQEAQLLGVAQGSSPGELATACRRARATSASRDPKAAYRRIHDQRSVTTWTDEEGALCLRGRFTPDKGARLATALDAAANQVFEAARQAGSTEPLGAYRADALVGVVCGDQAPTSPDVCVLVRVDADALVRGEADGDEVAEVDGGGTLPVPVIYDLMATGRVKVVVDRAGEVDRVFHFTRVINAHLATALLHRDPTCVVPGCGARRFLETDHVLAVEHGGPTCLSNLARLCTFHHDKKSTRGYTLWQDRAGWHFCAPPPFDEEPAWGEGPEWSPDVTVGPGAVRDRLGPRAPAQPPPWRRAA